MHLGPGGFCAIKPVHVYVKSTSCISLESHGHVVQELFLHLEVAPVLFTSSRFRENNGSTLFSVRSGMTRTSTMNISFSPTSRVIRRNLDSGRTAAGANAENATRGELDGLLFHTLWRKRLW
jgi:hypothetical protein